MFDKMLYVYAKHDGMKQFKAFDVNGCFTVERLISRAGGPKQSTQLEVTTEKPWGES